jgi:hypothetical protein
MTHAPCVLRPGQRCLTPETCNGGARCAQMAPYKVEPPSEVIGRQLRTAHASLATTPPLETPAQVIEAEASTLRVLQGDEQPATHADTAPTRTAQVIRWSGITRHDIPVDRIIEAAGGADLRVAVVIGYDAEGDEYFASSVSDGADIVWLLERMKLRLLTVDVEPNET